MQISLFIFMILRYILGKPKADNNAMKHPSCPKQTIGYINCQSQTPYTHDTWLLIITTIASSWRANMMSMPSMHWPWQKSSKIFNLKSSLCGDRPSIQCCRTPIKLRISAQPLHSIIFKVIVIFCSGLIEIKQMGKKRRTAGNLVITIIFRKSIYQFSNSPVKKRKKLIWWCKIKRPL